MEYTNNGQYKGLPVIQSEVEDCFEQYIKDVMPTLTWSIVKDINNGKQYKFTFGENEELLNVYYTKNKTATLTPTGTSNEITSQICNYIYGKYNNEGMKGVNEAFQKFPKGTYELIIEYFKKKTGVDCEEKKLSYGEQYIFRFRGENLVINYYANKGTLLLQGKANILFSEIIYLLITSGYNSSDILALEQLLHNKCFDDNIDVEKELKEKLPCAYGNLTEQHLKLIRPSIRSVLNGVDHGEDDNSCIAHSILRGVEQILKSYLFENDVEGICDTNSFENYISRKEVKKPVSDKITEPINQQAIVKLYCFYFANRHVIEHTKAIATDTVIRTCKEAYTLVYNALNAINEFYGAIV